MWSLKLHTSRHITRRLTRVSCRSVESASILGVAAAFMAQALPLLITLITNISFYGRFSLGAVTPAVAVAHLGSMVVLIPVAGALIVGFMARYGSKAIRGHDIPEAMEQVLTNESRIPAHITFLKPISSAIAMSAKGVPQRGGRSQASECRGKAEKFAHGTLTLMKRPCRMAQSFPPQYVGELNHFMQPFSANLSSSRWK